MQLNFTSARLQTESRHMNPSDIVAPMSPDAEQFLSGYGRGFMFGGGSSEGFLITAAGDVHWTQTPRDRPYAWLVSPDEEAAFTELVDTGYVEVWGPGWRFTPLGADWVRRNIAPGYEAALAVVEAFKVRGIAVSRMSRWQIMSEKDPGRLARWLEKAAVASSVDEVINDATGERAEK